MPYMCPVQREKLLGHAGRLTRSGLAAAGTPSASAVDGQRGGELHVGRFDENGAVGRDDHRDARMAAGDLGGAGPQSGIGVGVELDERDGVAA